MTQRSGNFKRRYPVLSTLKGGSVVNIANMLMFLNSAATKATDEMRAC